MLAAVLLPVAATVAAGPAAAAPAGFTLEMDTGGGTLQLRDAEPFALSRPTTIAGTVDTDTGAIAISSFSTPKVSFEQEVTSPIRATAHIDATFRTQGTGTGSVDADGNVVLTQPVAVDLQIEVRVPGSDEPLDLPGECTASPVELDMTSSEPFEDPDGPEGPLPGRVTVRASDFAVPTIPTTSRCTAIIADAVNDQLAGAGHQLSLALSGELPLPPPAGCQTTTTVAVSPAGSSPVGDPIEITATVTPVADDDDCTIAAAAGEVPVGAVDVLARGVVIGSADLDPSGVATYTVASLPAGPTVLAARYRGSAPFARSASEGVEQVVTAPPAITTTLPPFIEIGGGPVEFTFEVSSSGFATPIVDARLDLSLSSSSTIAPSMFSVEVFQEETWQAASLAGAGSRELFGSLADIDLGPGQVASIPVRLAVGAPDTAASPPPGSLIVAVDLVPGDAAPSPSPAPSSLASSGAVRTTLVPAERAPTTLTIGNPIVPAVAHTVRQGQTVVIGPGNVRLAATGAFPAAPPSGFVDVLLDGEPMAIAAILPNNGMSLEDEPRVALTGASNATPSVAFQLPATVPTGARQVTVRYSGDATLEPAQVSITLQVIPAVGVLYECRAESDPPKRFRASVVAQANLPASARAGSDVDLDHLAVRMLTDRSSHVTNLFSGLLANEAITPVAEDTPEAHSSLRAVTFAIGPDGAGNATAVHRSLGTRLPNSPNPAGADVNQLIDPLGETASVRVDGPVGSTVPVTLDAVRIETSAAVGGSNPDLPFNFVCEPVGDPVSFGEIRVSGVDVSVSPTGTSRAGEQLVVSADVGFAGATGVMELRTGETTVGLVPVNGRVTTIATRDLAVGQHSLTVRYYPTLAAPLQESAAVAHSVLPEFDCEAFVEEGSGAVVRLVYLELLGRCPDQAGFDHWTGRLDGGTSAEVFARSIARTPEAVGRVVDDAYVTMLGRPAEPAGRAYWTGRLQASGRYDSLLADLGASGEFWSRAGSTNDGFVTRVYDRLLNRAPDVGGLAYWSGRLDAGASRRALIVSLANLDEPLGRIVVSSYGEILDRAPFAAERREAVAFLRSTGDRSGLYAQLIGRPEFATRAQSLPNLGD